MSERSDSSLIAHWPFTVDCHEHAGAGLSLRNHGVRLSESGPRQGMGAAVFDGRSAFLEVEDHPVLKGGTREFTVTGWVYTSAQDSDVVADVIGKFDPGTRTGLHIRSFDSPGPDDGLDGRPT